MRAGTAIAGALAVALSSCALLIVAPGAPALSALPPLAAAALLGWLRLPLRTTVLCLFALVLALHSPQDRPADGLWVSPLEWLGTALTRNLNALVGGRLLPFSLVDAIAVLLLARAWNERKLGAGLPPPMLAATVVFAVALGAVVAHGLATGGDFEAAYWQIRQLVYVPVFILLFAAALRGREDVPLVGRIIVFTALLKAAVGLFFLVFIARARGLSPAYVTTHSDSMHFVLALVALAARWLEAQTRRHFAQALVAAPPLFAILLLNDRRLAWVGLLGAALIAFVYARRTLAKRRVARLFVTLLPLLAVYVAIGWQSKAAPFRPVQTMRSMIATEEDSSARWRDFENYNLAATVRRAPLLGQGLGHPYDEVVRAPSIERDFELWRHIPHNSVLWLLTVGGLVGFGALMSLFWTSSYFASRTLRGAEDDFTRRGALLAICATFVFLVQCFGDMGTQSWTTVVLFAATAAHAGRLAVAAGVWPKPRPRTLHLPAMENAR